MDDTQLDSIKLTFEMPTINESPFQYTLFNLILYEIRCNYIKDEVENYLSSGSITQHILENPILLAINLQQGWLIDGLIDLVVDKDIIKNFREYTEQIRSKNEDILSQLKKMQVSKIFYKKNQFIKCDLKEEMLDKEKIRKKLLSKIDTLYKQIDILNGLLNSNFKLFERSELTRLFTIINNLKYNLNSLVQSIHTLDIQI